MKYAAFFDLDHTILKINSGEALIRGANRLGLLSTGKLIKAYFLAILYKRSLMDPLKVIEKLSSWLTESPVNEVDTLCEEIVEKDLVPAIRPQMIDEIRKHKKLGAHLVILSSAIAPVCFRLAKHLEMDAVTCTELEVDKQQFTGRAKLGFCFRDEKLNRLNQYLQTNNFTREDSFYYADSIDDLPVLQSVGHAVCVNPGKRLKKKAREQNWIIKSWE